VGRAPLQLTASRLPAPAPAVATALRLLPHEPGVYILRDRAGRVVYIGRSRDLASRTRSYWSDLGDRPHLVRMIRRVEWLEPVLCASEHEAAFLESDLLERHPTRYNRTLGMESRVWLRLDGGPRRPGLEVVHEANPEDGAMWFGPYLGWEPVRQAAAGLHRLHPLRYTGTEMGRTDRELARSLGVSQADRTDMAQRIVRILQRDRAAVGAAILALEGTRDRAAASVMFEHAAAVRESIRGLRWISEPQKLASLGAVDRDYAAEAAGHGFAVRVVLALRGGRLSQRHVQRLKAAGNAPDVRAQPDCDAREWIEMARRNAELMASFGAARALGPVAWRG